MQAIRLNVTLTGTSNEHLVERLPLDGELEILETGLRGSIIAATFRIRDPKTLRLGAAVEVARPEFTYNDADARTAGFTLPTTEETRALQLIGADVNPENVAALRRLSGFDAWTREGIDA